MNDKPARFRRLLRPWNLLFAALWVWGLESYRLHGRRWRRLAAEEAVVVGEVAPVKVAGGIESDGFPAPAAAAEKAYSRMLQTSTRRRPKRSVR